MRNTAIISPPSGGLEKCSFSEKIQFCAHLLLHVGKPMDTWFAFPTWRNTFDFSPLSIQFSVYLMESKNAIGFPMAFGTGKGCWYFTSAPFILPVFDFLTSHRVPCLWKHWFYWTISCFLIRRRGNVWLFFWYTYSKITLNMVYSYWGDLKVDNKTKHHDDTNSNISKTSSRLTFTRTVNKPDTSKAVNANIVKSKEKQTSSKTE